MCVCRSSNQEGKNEEILSLIDTIASFSVFDFSKIEQGETPLDDTKVTRARARANHAPETHRNDLLDVWIAVWAQSSPAKPLVWLRSNVLVARAPRMMCGSRVLCRHYGGSRDHRTGGRQDGCGQDRARAAERVGQDRPGPCVQGSDLKIPLVFESGRGEYRGEDDRECSGTPRTARVRLNSPSFESEL